MISQNLFYIFESGQFYGIVVNKEKEWHSLGVQKGKMGSSSSSAAVSLFKPLLPCTSFFHDSLVCILLIFVGGY